MFQVFVDASDLMLCRIRKRLLKAIDSDRSCETVIAELHEYSWCIILDTHTWLCCLRNMTMQGRGVCPWQSSEEKLVRWNRKVSTWYNCMVRMWAHVATAQESDVQFPLAWSPNAFLFRCVSLLSLSHISYGLIWYGMNHSWRCITFLFFSSRYSKKACRCLAM